MHCPLLRQLEFVDGRHFGVSSADYPCLHDTMTIALLLLCSDI